MFPALLRRFAPGAGLRDTAAADFSREALDGEAGGVGRGGRAGGGGGGPRRHEYTYIYIHIYIYIYICMGMRQPPPPARELMVIVASLQTNLRRVSSKKVQTHLHICIYVCLFGVGLFSLGLKGNAKDKSIPFVEE